MRFGNAVIRGKEPFVPRVLFQKVIAALEVGSWAIVMPEGGLHDDGFAANHFTSG